MKLTYVLPLLLILTGCENPLNKTEEASTTSGAVASGTGYLWTNYPTAKVMRISNDFSPAEVDNIEDMGEAWIYALENKKDFFDFGAGIPEVCDSTVDLDDFYDGVFGIYKCSFWDPELYSSALAVTQIYAIRHNIGSPSEFIDIQHADILVNYDPSNHFTFDTTDNGLNYDLRTVILHEMGHFIGLEHKSTSTPRANSVMYPSIGTAEYKRAPKAADIADLSDKYDIHLAHSGNLAMVADLPKVEYKADPKKPSQHVKILMELRADGECVHKENGVPRERHFVKLK